MLDNELIKAFLPIINAGLVTRGFSDVVVRQSYQPTQQGADTGQAVYFFKIGDHRYGYLRREAVYDPIAMQETRTEIQFYETTFQISAWAIQNPADTNSITASDLVNTVAAILQGDDARVALAAQNIGILRVTDIRNPYFLDDFDRNEASPSFDFTLTHRQIYETIVPVITDVEFNIYEV